MAIAAAHAKAVALYFLLRNRLGTETVSWVCVLGAAPFAAVGFFRYHGMTFGKFLWVFLRSELLEPRVYLFKPRNHFAEITKEYRREQTRSQRKQKARVRLRKDKSKTRRRILYAFLCCPYPGRSASAVQGPCLRSMLRKRRYVRAICKIRSESQRQHQ